MVNRIDFVGRLVAGRERGGELCSRQTDCRELVQGKTVVEIGEYLGVEL